MAVFCRKCGMEVPEGQLACPKCGGQNLVTPGGAKPVSSGPITSAPAPSGGGVAAPPGPTITSPRPVASQRIPKRTSSAGATSGLAIASLVLGILGFGLIGLILGIVALSQINKSDGEIGGKGLAIGGIITSVVWGPMIFLAILFPVFAKGKGIAYSAVCMSRQQSISMCLEMYQQDNGGKMPPADGNWASLLVQYDSPDSKLFDCPVSPKKGTAKDPDYAVNAGLLGQQMLDSTGNNSASMLIANPQMTVMLADDAGTSHLLQSTGDIATTVHRIPWKDDPRSDKAEMREGILVTFADGHAEVVPSVSSLSLTVTRVQPPPQQQPSFGYPSSPPPMPY